MRRTDQSVQLFLLCAINIHFCKSAHHSQASNPISLPLPLIRCEIQRHVFVLWRC